MRLMQGQVSEDGQFIWDGVTWIPNPNAVPQQPAGLSLSVTLVRKRWFPSIKLTVVIKDILNMLNEEVSFSTMARTYTVKLANGHIIGKLPLQGVTVFSGAQGIISFPSGPSYNVFLTTSFFGPKDLTITNCNDGRRYIINF